jgi:zinc/manganese transport system ATP-binding protein/zinc transport system ATP-binding protein
LRDVTLMIPRGAFVGVVGPSGSGKTTLLRTILGRIPHVSGRVRVLGRDVRGTAPPGVGYVPQIETVDWNFPVTVEEVVFMGRTMTSGLLPWAGREDRRAISGILGQLGIGGLAKRHIRDLSGGQQQRAFLARALVSRPQILVLDEPTAGVDIKTRDDILHLLGDLNADGITVIMSTHELNSVAAHLPWVICVRGAIVASGDPEEVFTTEVLTKTYGAKLEVVRKDGLLLIADAPHGLREQLRHSHTHRHGNTEHEHGHGHVPVHAHQHDD